MHGQGKCHKETNTREYGVCKSEKREKRGQNEKKCNERTSMITNVGKRSLKIHYETRRTEKIKDTPKPLIAVSRLP